MSVFQPPVFYSHQSFTVTSRQSFTVTSRQSPVTSFLVASFF
ncbi:hypothetical protein CKA32_005626 [Geitlerinema sp. FC II]|nr:hypothetical protein CKA32_005626 [Geitlerinema sp. FC II]